jgi:ubiquinone/menaquinone biosynthesis C-methylase UbiE
MSLSEKYFKYRNEEEKTKSMYLRHLRTLKTINEITKIFYNKNISENSKFLDMGCGDGSFVNFLLSKKINAVGCDIDETNFENEKLKYLDESFDYVMLYSVIEHVQNTNNLLSEAYRVLKKGGIIIIICPNFRYCYSTFYDDPTHVKPFTDEGLKKILEIYKYKNIYVKPWTVNYNYFIWKLRFCFFYCAYLIPFRNDINNLIPKFLRGRSSTMIAVGIK